MRAQLLRVTVLSILTFALGGCRTIAIALAPSRTQEAPSADTARGEQLLAGALLEGDYEGLPQVIEELTRLSIAHPRDGRLHTMLGLAHLWRVSERDRAPEPSPRMTEHVVLARHYFDSASALLPNDARVLGWSAGARLASATLLDDQRARREGYFLMHDAIASFPEFNLFSASYVFSRLPVDDPKYLPEVVQPMFEAFRRCYGPADDWEARRAVLAAAMASPVETTGPERICYPSPLAPHNIEGFFVHFGDALSKAGQLEDARQAWSLATLAPSYESWPYRGELQARIADPEAHSRVARAGRSGEGMMITSRISCSGCHQR